MDAARFEFTDAAGRRRVVDITESPFRIGRSHTNQLALPSAEVSREHAEITWNGERFVARDCQSRAGTFVNDQPIGEQPIVGGDRVRIGPHLELTFATGERVITREHSSTTSSSAITDLRQTALLLEGLRALGTAKVLDHLLEMVIDSAVEISGAERGFIMLSGPAGALEFKMARRRDGVAMTGTQFEVSRKVPDEVYTTGETRLIEDLLDGDVAGGHEGTIALGIRNVLCAPLRVVELVAANEVAREERRIGVLYLDSRERKSFKSSAIRSAVETLANEAANAIENARLYREAQEKVRLEHDLQTAKEFQRALLPRAAPGLGFFEAVAEMQPCRMIDGDFYEYVRLADDAVGFTLGDVAGKGAPAGLLGARIQEIFLSQGPKLVAPARTMAAINETLLRKSLESRFVTMVYGVLSADGQLRYCNAGHNPPILISRDGVRRLEAGDLIVGLFEEAEYEEESVQLSPDDLLVIFSDGISEATNHGGEEFGDAGIIECLETNPAVHEPSALLDSLFTRIHEFTVGELQADDMTALVLRYKG